MAFVSKKDYCGLAVEGKLVCAGDQMGASSSDVTAIDDGGSVVAFTNVAGGKSATNQYDVKADVEFSGTNAIKIGKVNTVDGEKFMLSGVAFTTSAGAVPSFSASATDVEPGATTDEVYEVPAFTLPKKHKAAFVFTEATVGGEKCALIGTSYSIGATPTVDRDELGAPISSGISGCAITVTANIQQGGTAEPTVTPAEGWHVSSELTQTNSKGSYPTWTVALTKYLAKTTA